MDQMRNLHLKLVMRLLLVAAVVSVAAGALVIHNEHSRVFEVARDRALIRIGTLRALMLPQLDSGDLTDRGALESSVRTIAYKGFDLSTGHYVLLRILDLRLGEVARVADERFGGVDELIKRTERRPSTAPAGTTSGLSCLSPTAAAGWPPGPKGTLPRRPRRKPRPFGG